MYRYLFPALLVLALTLGLTSRLMADHHLEGEAPADNTLTDAEKEAGWELMFNGTDLSNWKVSKENADSVRVDDGMLITNGKCAHVYYGKDGDAKYKEFELEADVYCVGKSNSGIYILTQYQDGGWPAKGFECQVANGFGDPRKTASVYGIHDVSESPAKDDEWFHYHIKVQDGTIRIWINGKLAQEWTQPDDWNNNDRNVNNPGTIALQAHDPGSQVRYKNMKIRELE